MVADIQNSVKKKRLRCELNLILINLTTNDRLLRHGDELLFADKDNLIVKVSLTFRRRNFLLNFSTPVFKM